MENSPYRYRRVLILQLWVFIRYGRALFQKEERNAANEAAKYDQWEINCVALNIRSIIELQLADQVELFLV